MKLILPKLYTFTGLLLGRVYLIEDADGLTIIDTSLAQTASRIITQLEAMGRKLSDVKRILITHAHIDHIGGLPTVQQRTGAQVIANTIDREAIEGQAFLPMPPRGKLSWLAAMMRAPDTKVSGTPVDRVIGDGDVLPDVMGGLQAIALPGHTLGQLGFWQPTQRLLFCGDTLMRMWGLSLPFAGATVDMDKARQSVQRVADMEPSIVCFGHGAPLRQNTVQQIKEFARKIQTRP
jgi:glyoxylase-like metal-dependent hydrolase (beta-lactamase superfamily II)